MSEIDMAKLSEFLGFAPDYKFYSGSVAAGAPKILKVESDLGRSSRRGWFKNDDAADSVFVSINQGDKIEVKFGEELPLDHVRVKTMTLSCTAGSPAFRAMLW